MFIISKALQQIQPNHIKRADHCYILAATNHRQISWIGDRASDLAPHLYADTEFTGCKVTQRSTGGGHLAILEPNSCFPHAGISSRHDAISSSTPEAEMYTGHIIMKCLGIRAKDMWSVLLRKHAPLYFHEDNQAVIQLVQTWEESYSAASWPRPPHRGRLAATRPRRVRRRRSVPPRRHVSSRLSSHAPAPPARCGRRRALHGGRCSAVAAAALRWAVRSAAEARVAAASQTVGRCG